MRSWKAIALILSMLFLAGCATIRFERRLADDIKDWYQTHSLLMDVKAPKNVFLDRPTEKSLFLRMLEAAQREHIKIFWQIREGGKQDEFRQRLELADLAFGREGIIGRRTDRGWLLLLCGPPDYVEHLYVDDQAGRWEPALEGQEEWASVERGHYVQKWIYWFSPHGFWSQIIEFDFIFSLPYRWGLSTIMTSEQRQFIDYHRERMGPTGDGWDIVVGILLEKDDG